MARLGSGFATVIFGSKSFGEGFDRPGNLCETVFITKLPFAPPAAPVAEARAEWLRAVGRDPFNELVIRATGTRTSRSANSACRPASTTS